MLLNFKIEEMNYKNKSLIYFEIRKLGVIFAIQF